ncbi:P-loop containing nucleoside triphosphate hydrolase protein [Scenedesmus sp. NREL 46B-D3]|nr:P-loop containing nucleoside triphosphate hydrolase protein [Scenedesmus sp. NREL 46B-D3]
MSHMWLSVRLEGMGALCTLLAALVTVEQQSGRAATMGLLLTYALQITAATSMTLRVGSTAEQTFNAVERVQEYCHLPQELSKTDGSSDAAEQSTGARSSSGSGGGRRGSGEGSGGAATRKAGRPYLLGLGARRDGAGVREPLLPVAAADGATSAGAAASEVAATPAAEGHIEFRDVNLRYRPGLPLVLRGLSFTVEPGWKVGVVGRTGAGKSSLIGALFRLTEIESGLITIDGVNTKALALRQLRSSMALIPQVPVLFTGSIRENLAPIGGHCDAALWSALRRAHLAPVVEGWEREGLGGLDYQLGEGGSPLSAGQKQLLALARALLNPAKILVLDEATANVDVETDALIQKTLREEFADRTLLAVAHRLHTIIEADRVLVMQQGAAAEYGAPAALLKDDAGHFTGMVRETGDATEKFLRSMAAGDEEAHRELHVAAAAALVNLTAACTTAAPACLAALASNLAQGAAQLNHQVNALLQLLQRQAHEASVAFAVSAFAAQHGAAGTGSASGGHVRSSSGTNAAASSADQVMRVMRPGLLPAAASGSAATGASLDTAATSAAAATMQQLKAALAATAQLQQFAVAAQQLVDSGADVSAAAGALHAQQGSEAADAGDTASAVRRRSREDEFREGMTGGNSPFAELLLQQMSSAPSGSNEAAAAAAMAASGSNGMAARPYAAMAPATDDTSDRLGSLHSWTAGAGDALGDSNSSNLARLQGPNRLARSSPGSGYLRRLSLEVNPVGSRRVAASHSGRVSADLPAAASAAAALPVQAAAGAAATTSTAAQAPATGVPGAHKP